VAEDTNFPGGVSRRRRRRRRRIGGPPPSSSAHGERDSGGGVEMGISPRALNPSLSGLIWSCWAGRHAFNGGGSLSELMLQSH